MVINMSFIQGIIKQIVFHSDANSFNILKVKITETDEVLDVFMMDDYMTITGYFPLPLRGEERSEERRVGKEGRR